MSVETHQEEAILQMNLDYDGGNILTETVRWSRFLSIVGLIGLALCALAFTLLGTALIAAFSRFAPGLEQLGALGGAIVIAVALAVIAFLGFVVFMLYRFSVLTRKGIENQDQVLFARGMNCLKIYFIISGIFAILGLVFNLLSLTKLFHP